MRTSVCMTVFDHMRPTVRTKAIDVALDTSTIYGESLEGDRKLLQDHRRQILRTAAEDIANLTLR